MKKICENASECFNGMCEHIAEHEGNDICFDTCDFAPVKCVEVKA